MAVTERSGVRKVLARAHKWANTYTRIVLVGRDCAVLILDINMPGEDDFSISGRARTRGNMRSPLLTADDRGVELEPGVDDDLMKPSEPREPCARIHALFRRAGRVQESQSQQAPFRVERARFSGDLLLNPDARCLSWLDDTGMRIDAAEFEVPAASACSPDRLLGHETPLGLAGSHDYKPCDRSIDVRGRIQRGAERDPEKPQMIQTIRGAGSMFVPREP